MAANMPGVTDVTDVTRFPHSPYTCVRARKNTLGERVTSDTSVTGIPTLSRLAADFLEALPGSDWATATSDRHKREAVRSGLVEREKLGPGVYRYRRAVAR